MVKVEMPRVDWEIVMIALENEVFDNLPVISVIYSQIEDQINGQEY